MAVQSAGAACKYNIFGDLLAATATLCCNLDPAHRSFDVTQQVPSPTHHTLPAALL